MLFIVRVIIDITRPGPSVCHITYQNVFEWVRKHELIFGNSNIDVDLLIVQQQRREWWFKWFFHNLAKIHFWNTEIIKFSFGVIYNHHVSTDVRIKLMFSSRGIWMT